MRLLTTDELDEVYGGTDRISATTLSTVTVNATIAANPNIAWSNGGALGIGQATYTHENSQAPCYANMYKALNAIPGFPHLRCVAHKTTHPGHDLADTLDMTILNGYAYVRDDSLTDVVVKNSPGAPPGYNAQLDGLYSYKPTAYQVVTLTASSMVGYNADINFIDPDNPGAGVQTFPGPFTASEWQAFVMAHEASHQTGISGNENLSNGYGIYAVRQYRAGAAASCPQ